MEVTVYALQAELTLETFAGELKKSASIWLDGASKLIASVPLLAFHFNKPSFDDDGKYVISMVLHIGI